MLLMKFEQQQKGLFTFYKQQELFQQQTIKRKTKQKTQAQRKVESQAKTSSQTDFKILAKTKIDSQPTPSPQKPSQQQKAQRAIKYKKYGQAVVIINRKQAQQLKPQEIRYEGMTNSNSKQQGYFLQNKNVQFDSPLKEYIKERQTLTRRKIHFLKRREDSVMSSKKYDQNSDRTNRLPSLARGQLRNKINGSLIKSNGSQLLRQIRSNAINDSGVKKEEANRSVSYIQYNKNYYNEGKFRKKDKLSSQQKKLLQILSRYRRNDF